METSNWTTRKFFGALILLVILIFVYQWVSSPMVVTVTGVGEIVAPAESAVLTFSVSGNSSSPQEATASVKDKLNKIKDTLKASGIVESDIYESQVAVYPASVAAPGASGFQAVANMGFKTVQINNLDNLTNTLYAQGATVVTQPVLSVGDNTNLESEAYNLAIKDAKKQANSLALRNLKFIKKIVLIQESQTPTSSTVTSKVDTVTQIEKNLPAGSGVIKINKTVQVSYKMW